MDCQRVRIELGEHALGTTPAPRAVALDQHLHTCAACRTAYEEEMALLTVAAKSMKFRGRGYTFAQLRARMAVVEPLDRVLVLLPKLQKIGRIPRYMAAMGLLVFYGGFSYAARNAGELYAVCRQDPFLEERYAMGQEFPEIYKTLYVDPTKGNDSPRA